MLNITNYQRNANQNYNKVSPHTSQMAIIKKIHKQKMLERVQREENPPTVLVGMYIGIVTMENSTEVP